MEETNNYTACQNYEYLNSVIGKIGLMKWELNTFGSNLALVRLRFENNKKECECHKFDHDELNMILFHFDEIQATLNLLKSEFKNLKSSIKNLW